MDEENKTTISFDDLKINDNLLRGIYSYGFENPSKIQSLAIPKMVEGGDLIAQAHSGTGKTGAFSIGSLQKLETDKKESQILIISPTHELVHQTTEVIREISKHMNISFMEVIGGTNVDECRRELDTCPQVLIGTPGRVLDMIQKNYLYTDKLKTLVFDEADEILSAGFKETVHDIIKFIPRETQICLFSATMPEEVLQLANCFMNNPEKILVKKEELTLEGITQFYVNMKVNDWKFDVLTDLYDTINIAQCIIYINSKNKLMDIYTSLINANFPVSCIHGELPGDQSGHSRILLSTDLLSRGIDVQQLSLVINFDLPKSKETYIHRIGRSGRYGRKGVAINLVTDRDMQHLKDIETFYETKITEMPSNIADIISGI